MISILHCFKSCETDIYCYPSILLCTSLLLHKQPVHHSHDSPYCCRRRIPTILNSFEDGSEHGKVLCIQLGAYGPVAQMLPPLVIGILVQCINMPLVRATITIQNPKSQLLTVSGALQHIYSTRRLDGRQSCCSLLNTVLSAFERCLTTHSDVAP